MLRFHETRNIDSDILYCSDVWTESNWPIVFVIRVMFTEEYDESWAREHGKYHVEIHAVSPAAVSDEHKQHAASSCGFTLTDFNALPIAAQAEMLLDYGTSATLWQETSNNMRQGIKHAREEMKKISFLFGFYMDRQANAIGNTGWDFIRGDIGFHSACR